MSKANTISAAIGPKKNVLLGFCCDPHWHCPLPGIWTYGVPYLPTLPVKFKA